MCSKSFSQIEHKLKKRSFISEYSSPVKESGNSLFVARRLASLALCLSRLSSRRCLSCSCNLSRFFSSHILRPSNSLRSGILRLSVLSLLERVLHLGLTPEARVESL